MRLSSFKTKTDPGWRHANDNQRAWGKNFFLWGGFTNTNSASGWWWNLETRKWDRDPYQVAQSEPLCFACWINISAWNFNLTGLIHGDTKRMFSSTDSSFGSQPPLRCHFDLSFNSKNNATKADCTRREAPSILHWGFDSSWDFCTNHASIFFLQNVSKFRTTKRKKILTAGADLGFWSGGLVEFWPQGGHEPKIC